MQYHWDSPNDIAFVPFRDIPTPSERVPETIAFRTGTLPTGRDSALCVPEHIFKYHTVSGCLFVAFSDGSLCVIDLGLRKASTLGFNVSRRWRHRKILASQGVKVSRVPGSRRRRG